MIIDSKQSKVGEESKKEYAPPKLTDYGSVTRLTQGGNFIGNDGNTSCNGNANPNRNCSIS